ncbi:glycoside hydrolase family 2 protein [uncultured Porphyromonas sp.]|uniref:glycoside hydrolase family 2 protein n=1 Tax=uncultured Porphyromonas sp. TaxID=159274 RepID=UPI00262289BC|nr:glycoside hydrolase family 2 protein [uncultured Porphyromonas sp.]
MRCPIFSLSPLRLLTLFVGMMTSGSYLSPSLSAQSTETVSLHGGWSLRESSGGEWLPATVPGVVQQDLIRHGRLPDPYYRLAEDSIQWVGERDWVYRCAFDLTPAQLAYPSRHLLFEGLDTYARVYLNGQLILSSGNMFVRHEVDVRRYLRRTNTLELHFSSPLRAALPLYEASGKLNYPADNDHSQLRLSVFTRKAPYHYGWDWGERMLTLGPWRPIRLLLRQESYFADRPLVTYHPEDREPIELRIPPGSIVGRGARQLRYRLRDREGAVVYEHLLPLPSVLGQSPIIHRHTLTRPKLWWPQGMGEPYLYTAELELLSGERGAKPLDSQSLRVGLRTVELVREADSLGRSFFFRVNGRPIYAKGANYIPPTLMLPTRSDEELRQLFDDVTDSHFNMLRVWGGGVYEEDRFYDLADERGILIWQDFMFACTAYPGDDAFLSNVSRELVDNIRRLRSHPSIAVWCGNNEIREAMKYWGWQKKYPKETYQLFARDYVRLFRQLIPSQLRQHDPLRPYIESSPDTANWGRPETLGLGESHYWGVWYGREPFEILRERLPRFMSEFGVQSFPTLPSLMRFSRPEDWEIESPVMRAHQKSSIGNDVILHYIRQEYPEPKTFEDFAYLSQVMQGRGIALGLRVQRAAAPRCMGSLYWQINDAWPAVSWSSIDYYGTWKGLQYQAQRAFAPMILVTSRAGDSVRLVSDDAPEGRRVRLEARVSDFEGRELYSWRSAEVSLGGGMQQHDFAVPFASFYPDEEARRQRFVHYRLVEEGGGAKTLAEELYYALPPRDLRLPEARDLRYTIEPEVGGEGYILTLSSACLVKDLYLECILPGVHLSDNFLDLLPGRPLRLRLSARAGYQLPARDALPTFTLRSINELIHRPPLALVPPSPVSSGN